VTGRHTGLACGLLGLAAGLLVTAVAGPAGLELVRYHVSAAVEAQTVAVDVVGALVVAPLMVLLAHAAWHGRPRVARLAVAPAAYTAYMAVQALAGQDYLGTPGTAQRLAPLHLLLVGGGVLVGVRAWGSGSTEPAGRWSDRRTTAGVAALLALATFVVLGRWAGPLLDAMGDRPSGTGYLDAPQMFWVLAVLDLGLVAPAVLATAVGLRRGSTWARNLFPVLTLWFALVGVSVLAMSMTMLARGVAGASVAGTAVLGVAAVAFVTLAARTLYELRPESPVGLPRWGEQEVTHVLRQEARARHPSGGPSGPA
jgi:hypothetical protein